MRLFHRDRDRTASKPSRPRTRRSFQVEHLECRDLQASLIPGGIVSGAINNRGTVESWTFRAKARDLVEVNTAATSGQSGFRTVADVYAPSGKLVSGEWNGPIFTLGLPETGTYTVRVRDDNRNETGRYTIGLESLRPASPDAKSLGLNTTVDGTINTAIQLDQWRVTVPAGKELKLTLTGPAKAPNLQVTLNLYDSSGNLVGYMWEDTRTFPLPKAGTYLIQVNGRNLAWTGSYKLKATLV